MKKIMIATIGAGFLLAGPAFAQSSTSNSSSAQSNTTSSSSSHQSMQQVQQKITQNLRNDGYQDVRVIPNSFLVHAKNKQGEPVVMIINPDSVFAVVAQSDNAKSSGNSNQSAMGNSPNTTGNSTTKQ